MKKVISIALFGEGDNYAQYLPAFVRAHLNLFPLDEGWNLRVHYDDVVAANRWGAYLERLAHEGLVELAPMGPAILTKAMLWRMTPVFDVASDYVFCRDLDAPPMPRDRACCDAFIFSGAVVHTIHDNQQHVGIMGGLCGFKAADFRATTGIRSLDSLYQCAQQTVEQWGKHGTDQMVLNRLLLRLGGPTLLEHRFNGWFGGPGVQPARAAGVYACEAWSTPTPNEGVHWFETAVGRVGFAATDADRLANHLGAAGYDHEAAKRWWDEHGLDEDILRRIATCEVP